MSRDVPITAIAGYLGAGKTTLLNRILHHAGDLTGTAVLVNDFGDVNIDAELISAANPRGDVIALSNGCVCCTIQDDLTQALERLRDFELDHVLLEASGVASPAKLRQQCSYPGFTARGCLVVVDAQQHGAQRNDKYVGHLVQQQVVEADLVVLSKSEAAARLPVAADFTADDPALPGLVLDVARDISAPPSRSQPNAEPPKFASSTLRQRAAIERRTLDALLNALPDHVVRVKGFAQTSEGPVLVQRVGRQVSLTPSPNQSQYQLVFISSTSLDPAGFDAWSYWFAPPGDVYSTSTQ